MNGINKKSGPIRGVTASVIVLVSALVIAPASALNSPIDVINQAVAQHDVGHVDLIGRFFTIGMQRDLQRVAAIENCNYWDADILSGKQEVNIVTITNAKYLTLTRNIAIVRADVHTGIAAFLRNGRVIPEFKYPFVVQKFILLLENGNWKIDEILWSTDNIILPADWTAEKRSQYFIGTFHANLRALADRNCER